MTACLAACPKWRLLSPCIFLLLNSADPFSDSEQGTHRKPFTPRPRYKTGPGEGSRPTDDDLHSIYMLFACSLTRSQNPPRAPTPPRKLLNQGSLAEVPVAFVPGPSLTFPLTSLVFSRTPGSSPWALLKYPPSWRSWAASVARGPGPGAGTPLPATLQGPLSALQGAAPFANGERGGGRGAGGWLGLGVTAGARGPTREPRSGRPRPQGRRPAPPLAGWLPRDPGGCGRWGGWDPASRKGSEGTSARGWSSPQPAARHCMQPSLGPRSPLGRPPPPPPGPAHCSLLVP